jgi:multidrug efflux pump subunit AcrA (membrane-fusion protein)
MPVQVQPVTLNSVPNTDTYVSTIKSLRSATLQPQVDGNLTRIYVKSGDAVKAGQILMQVDPLKQVATVQAQQGTEQQLKATFEYNQSDLARQEQLYKAGIISKLPELQGGACLCRRSDEYSAAGAGVLPDTGSVCRDRRRCAGPPRRLRLHHHRPHHRGREQGT